MLIIPVKFSLNWFGSFRDSDNWLGSFRDSDK